MSSAGSSGSPSVLFLCLGNICRSPLAVRPLWTKGSLGCPSISPRTAALTQEGVFRDYVSKQGLVDKIVVDSAGTGHWHVGDPPESNGQACARKHGLDISDLRARQLNAADFERFDLIVAMDRSNVDDAQRVGRRVRGAKAEVRLFSSFLTDSDVVDVPDCYYADGPPSACCGRCSCFLTDGSWLAHRHQAVVRGSLHAACEGGPRDPGAPADQGGEVGMLCCAAISPHSATATAPRRPSRVAPLAAKRPPPSQRSWTRYLPRDLAGCGC